MFHFVDSISNMRDASQAAYLQRFLDANTAYGATVRLPDADWFATHTWIDLLPAGAQVLREVSEHLEDGRAEIRSGLAVCGEATFCFEPQYGARGANLHVFTASREATDELVASIRATVPEGVADDRVPVGFWHLGRHGDVETHLRKLEVPSWGDISANYPGDVRSKLNALMNLKEPTTDGRLILWHGPPGTGKTTALRALSRAWQSWCAVNYVADAERMFQDAQYLMEVGSQPTSSRKAWRLVVAEDNDEFLRADARKTAGAALGRLLNFADGMLGQGSRTLFLLTTNEPLGELHPAVVRPGRALAEIGFERFSPAEARVWLPEGVPAPHEPLTLAEMYERSGTISRIANPASSPMPSGMYL